MVAINKTLTSEGLSPSQIVERQFQPHGTIWQFPAKPTVEVVHGDTAAKVFWQASGVAEQIALGSDDAFIRTLDPFTLDMMRECSPSGLEQTAYMEMFAYGADDYFSTDDETKRHRFDEHYLGAWEDPSFAAGAFVRDLRGTKSIDPSKRRDAYERLKQMIQIVEHPMPTGRTLVISKGHISDEERFIVNQYMIHDHIPEIVRF
jgi:hypothetical protein